MHGVTESWNGVVLVDACSLSRGTCYFVCACGWRFRVHGLIFRGIRLIHAIFGTGKLVHSIMPRICDRSEIRSLFPSLNNITDANAAICFGLLKLVCVLSRTNIGAVYWNRHFFAAVVTTRAAAGLCIN